MQSEVGIMDAIIAGVNQFPQLSGWKLTQTKTTSQEIYLVRQEMDMARTQEVLQYQLTVYLPTETDGSQRLGLATVVLHPSMTDSEISQKISQAVFASQFIHNPPFPLVKPDGAQTTNPHAKREMDLVDKAIALGKAMTQAAPKGKGWLNSGEIFIHRIQTRIRNSEGIDCIEEGDHGFFEVIITHPSKGEEVEIYKSMKFTGFPLNFLNESLEESYYFAQQRSLAQPTPSSRTQLPVILGGEAVPEFFHYYLAHASAKMVYEEISTQKPGDSVHGTHDILEDQISIRLDPHLDGGAGTGFFDTDGFLWYPAQIIQNGVLKQYWGNTRYAHYVGCPPTGDLSNFVVQAGKTGIDEMRSDPHYELVAFSSFEMEAVTGDFAGEIRLGWYDDGNQKIPITGGSVSGNIHNVQSHLRLSKETVQLGNYQGPSRVRMMGATIAGCM